MHFRRMADYRRPLRMYIKAGLGVLVECRKCGHSAVFEASALAARWGAEADPAFLWFRCYARMRGGGLCRSRNVRVSPDWPSDLDRVNKPE